MGLAFAAGQDLDVGPFLQGDAKGFCCIGSVSQRIDSSDQRPPAPDEEAGDLLCSLRHLLRAHLHPRRHHPSTQHPDPPGWVLQDVLFECVLSWWFSGRS